MPVVDRTTVTSRLAAGTAGGITAYVLGYLAVYVTQRGRVDEQLRGFNALADLLGGDPIPAWQAVGWVFYNAHFVATELPAPLGGVRTENFIASAESGALAALYLVPLVSLVGAGLLTGRAANAETHTAGARAGGFVVVGYLPLAAVGAVAFSYSVGDGAIAPDLLTAVLLAGVVYPVALGGAGGAAAALLGGE